MRLRWYKSVRSIREARIGSRWAHGPQRRSPEGISKTASLSGDRPGEGTVPRIRHRSHKAPRLRRRGRPSQHAMANHRRRESQGCRGKEKLRLGRLTHFVPRFIGSERAGMSPGTPKLELGTSVRATAIGPAIRHRSYETVSWLVGADPWACWPGYPAVSREICAASLTSRPILG